MFEWQSGVPILDETPEGVTKDDPIDNEDILEDDDLQYHENDAKNENDIPAEEIVDEDELQDNEDDDEHIQLEINAIVSDSDDDDLFTSTEDDKYDISGSNEFRDRNNTPDDDKTPCGEESMVGPTEPPPDEFSDEDEEQVLAPITSVAASRSQWSNVRMGVNHLDVSGKRKYYKTRCQYIQFLMEQKGIDHAQLRTYLNVKINVCFSQMSAKAGIKTFGQRAVAARFKEFQQLDQGAVPGKSVVGPVDPDKITPQEKMQAITDYCIH